jgi:hypothetical protein
VSTAGFFTWMPALFTRQVIGPDLRGHPLDQRCRLVELRHVVHDVADASGPSSAHAATSSDSRRPTRTTRAPADAMARAMASPMPVPPPVITATSPPEREYRGELWMLHVMPSDFMADFM